jgi:hypothetical protein
MGNFWLITNDQQKANAAAAVSLLTIRSNEPMCVKIEPYSEKRRNAQNRLMWMWNNEVSKQGREYLPKVVHAMAKGRYGVPILLAELEGFEEKWERVKRYAVNEAIFSQSTEEPKTAYECEIEILEDFPITSLMNVKQMNRYLTDFQKEASKKYRLTDPSDLMLDLR